MGRAFACGAAAATALLAAHVARAAIVTYDFTGTVSILTQDGGLFGAPGTVQVGDPFTGHLTYETGPGNPDQVPADSVHGFYEVVEVVVDQSVLAPFSPLGITVTHDAPKATVPPNPPDVGKDWFVATTTTQSVYPTVSVRLLGPYESAFADDSLPASLDPADFTDRILLGFVAAGIYPLPSIEDAGTIDSLVLAPEPGPAALGAACVAALALRRALAQFGS